MKFLKLLNPFVKLTQSTLLNVQPNQTLNLLKCVPSEKCRNNYTVNNVSLTDQVRKFTTCSTKYESFNPLLYQKESKAVLDKFKTKQPENTKNYLKINDVFVMVRKDVKNNRTITLKLTKEFLKPMPFKPQELSTKDLNMPHQKEITPPFIDNAAKYLNSIHDCCMNQKSHKNKGVSFSDYLPRKNSSEDKLLEINNDEKVTKKLENSNDEHRSLASGKTEDAMTDNEITQYVLDSKNYLNSIQNCYLKSVENCEASDCTKYITDVKHPPSKSTKKEIEELFTKSGVLSHSREVNTNHKKLLTILDPPTSYYSSLLLESNKNPTKQKMLQLSMAAMILNYPVYDRNAVRNIVESNKTSQIHRGTLLSPHITISNLITNKVGGCYCNKAGSNVDKNSNEENRDKADVYSDCEKMDALDDVENKTACCANSSCIIKKCLSAVRTINKDNKLEKYLEKLSEKKDETITDKNIENIVKNRQERIKKGNNPNSEFNAYTPSEQLKNQFEKSIQPCSNHKENLQPAKNFAAKCKILKISIAELLSNSDYLNRHPNTEAFSQCIKFADQLEKQKFEKNKVSASEVPMADLIANKLRTDSRKLYLEGKPEEDKTKNVENNTQHLEKTIHHKVLQDSSNICKTQIGSKNPEGSPTTKC